MTFFPKAQPGEMTPYDYLAAPAKTLGAAPALDGIEPYPRPAEAPSKPASRQAARIAARIAELKAENARLKEALSAATAATEPADVSRETFPSRALRFSV